MTPKNHAAADAGIQLTGAAASPSENNFIGYNNVYENYADGIYFVGDVVRANTIICNKLKLNGKGAPLKAFYDLAYRQAPSTILDFWIGNQYGTNLGVNNIPASC